MARSLHWSTNSDGRNISESAGGQLRLAVLAVLDERLSFRSFFSSKSPTSATPAVAKFRFLTRIGVSENTGGRQR